MGSGAGPWGYTTYTGSLGILIRVLFLLYHMFADDTQLHTSLRPSSKISQFQSREKLEQGLEKVAGWMTENRLKLNSEKTEFILIGTRQQLKKMEYNSIRIGDDTVMAKPCIRNLGIWMDSELKMVDHVHHIQRVCYMNLRELRSIRKYLTVNATRSLVQAMVMSHLDYGNSLLYGINDGLLDKLQKVQNSAARLVLGLRKYDHIEQGRRNLHWLPVRYRILFKIAAITYKVLSTNQPAYLRELLEYQQTNCRLRSRSLHLLKVPKSKLKQAGDRSFAVASPTVWNSLPHEVKASPSIETFRKKLKTHLFRIAYP